MPGPYLKNTLEIRKEIKNPCKSLKAKVSVGVEGEYEEEWEEELTKSKTNIF